MKINLLFYFMLAFNYLNAQNYIPIPLENTFWRISEGGGEPACICSREIICKTENDSLYNGITYKKINFYGSPFCFCQGFIGLPNGGLIRQDNSERKVYFIEKDSIQEKILFDFNQQIGDTLNSLLSKNEANEAFIAIIQNIDSLLINGIYHKRFRIQNCSFEIIEGIGSTSGLLGPLFPFEWITSLICMNNDSEILYPDGISDCEENVEIIEKSKSEIIYFENLNNETIKIKENKNNPIQLIKLINSIGKTIQTVENQNLNNIIDVSKLNAGIYFIVVETVMNETISQRFIKY